MGDHGGRLQQRPRLFTQATPLAWRSRPAGRPALTPTFVLLLQGYCLCSALYSVESFNSSFSLCVANNKKTKTLTSWQPDFLRHLSNNLKRFFSTKGNLLYAQIHLHILKKFLVITAMWRVDSCTLWHMGQGFVKTHLPPGAWRAALCQAGVGKRGLSLYSAQAKSSSHIF